MNSFSFTPDKVQTPVNDLPEFSFTPDKHQPDFSKIKGRDVANSNNPVNLVTRVAKAMFGKVSPVGTAALNLGTNIGKSIGQNPGIIGDYVSEMPKTFVAAGLKLGETAQNIAGAVSNKLDEQKLYTFQNPDENDTMGAFTKELVKGTVAEVAVNTPKMASDLTYWLGTNMRDPDSGQTNAMSDGFLMLSETFKNIAEYMGDIDILKSQALPSMSDSLSWGQIGSIGGHGIGQGVTMAVMARTMGSKAAYGFYALAGGADVFKESYQKEGDMGKANTLAAMNAASTYMIDRWFDPLPENIATGARMTAKQVSKEIGKAVVKEPLSEGLQQVFAENLVRKIGLDTEQDLFEGVIESMIGALGGAAAMGAASGAAAYSADRHYQQAKEKALQLGAEPSEIEQYRRASEEKLRQHPEVFDTVFQQNAQQTMNEINSFVKENGNPEEVRKALQTKADLEEVYNKVFDVLKNYEDEKVASAQAKVVQGVTLWGSQELGISPLEYFEQRFPEIEKVSYKDFLRRIREREDNGMGTLRQDIARLKRGISSKSKDTRKSLSQFVKENGGIRDDRGDIATMDPAPGILNKNGAALDEMTRMAWEAGYLQGTERPEINQFLDALDKDLRGNGVYSANEQIADAEAERRYLANLSEAIDRAGGDIRIDDAETIYHKLRAYEDTLSGQETPALPEGIDDFVNFQGQIVDNGRGVELTINSNEEMQGLSDEDFKNKMIDTLKSFKGNKIFNQSLNGDIEIRTSSIKKYKSLFADKNKRLIVPYIPELLGKAKFDKLEASYIPNKETNVKAYYKADLPINIDNDIYNVHLTVKEDNRGNLFWDAQVQEKSPSADPATNPGVKGPKTGKSVYENSISLENKNVNKPLYQLPAEAYNKQGKADVNSEAFKRWFGDSKVVDEKGKPLVVYHGTIVRGFKAFSEFKPLSWFSVDKEYAKVYSKTRKEKFYERGKTYPVYLSIKNPFMVDDIDNAFDSFYTKEDYYKKLSEKLNISLDQLKKELEPIGATREYFMVNSPEFRNLLQSLGYDGIQATEYGKTTYAVFNPNQIKSVNNRGTFDPESNNIYYQPAFAGSRVDYDKPSLEAIGSGEGAQAHGWGLYYALNRDVAEEYRKKLSQYNAERWEYNGQKIVDYLGITPIDLGFAVIEKESSEFKEILRQNIASKRRQFDKYLDEDNYKKWDGIYKKVLDLDVNKIFRKPAGQVHEVDIPENPYLLDEQKPFSEQSDIVKKALQNLNNAEDLGLFEVDGLVIKSDTTGKEIYQTIGKLISSKIGRDKKTSELLEKYGIKGITYDGQQDGRCFVIFNPDDVKVIQKFYQDQSIYRDPKGAFSQRINDKALISLFERADASTFMHETAHFFFEELKAFAKTSEKSAQMLNAINQWLGSDGKTYTVEQTEQFARGFEQYLREGNAPNNYLKRAFNAFINWLRQLYRTASELNVKLNDDVRGVYGEILGGKELDNFLEAPIDEVLGATKRYFAAKREAMDGIYTQNSEAMKARNRIFTRGRETTQKVYEGMRDWLQDALVPLEEVIKGISPELYNMNRRLEISKLQRTKGYFERVKGFIDKAQKMSADDFYTFDLALKNRDTEKAAFYLKKYNIEQDFGEVRKILDELREQMLDVGVDVAYLPDYFPRVIKDADGLLDYVESTFYGRPEYSVIQKVLEEKAKDGRIRTKEDEAQIINSLIRGYAGGISLANIGNVKERSIQVIDQFMNRYYKSSLDALSSYISGSVQLIENKKYFGKETKELQNLRRMVANRETTIAEYKRMEPKEAKWKEIKTRNYKIGAVEAQIRNTFDKQQKAELQERKTRLEAEVEYLQKRRAEQVKEVAINRMQVELDQIKKEVDALADSTIENSIGNLLRELSEQGKIGHTQELRLKELLLSRFSNKGLGNEFLRLLRDGGYIWTLGNIESAITQFGDLGTSAFKNGLWNTGFEYVKAWRGKSEITIDDLGLAKVIQDGGYADISAWSKYLDKVLKYTGFEKMDKIAKQTLVNSAIRKARKDAVNNAPELEEYLRAEFGEKWVDVKEDLKTGAITDEIIEYAMFQLMDVQPITIDQMPRYYAEGGKKRMFYMMKSYFIKQLNEYRKICFETAKANPRKAVIDMTRLTVYLMLFNAGADVLKDLLFGRKINVPDTLVDNIFIGGSINRYQAMSVKREGLFKTLQKQLMFPVMMDELVVDVLSQKEIKDWNTWKNVPLVGRPYYWYIGGGVLKKEKEKKKARNERRNQRRRRRED